MTQMQQVASALWWAVACAELRCDPDSVAWAVVWEFPALATEIALMGDGEQVLGLTVLSGG